MSKEENAPYSFKGDNAKLVDSIKSLLALDSKGALVPNGIGGMARQLLESAVERLGVDAQPVAYISASVLAHLMAGGDAGWQWIGPVAYGSDQVGLYTRSDAGEVERLHALCVEKDERMAEMNKGWAAAIEQRDTLRAELGECKGEYDRAVNKVDALRGQLAERDELIAVMLARLNKAQIFGYDRNVKALSASVEPIDLESRPEERGCPDLEPCPSCGTPGWTAACDKCIPY